MKYVKETGNIPNKKETGYLLGKPVWSQRLVFIAEAGGFFIVLSLVLYLLTIQWWVGVLLLVAVGIIVSLIKYISIHKRIGIDKKQTL